MGTIKYCEDMESAVDEKFKSLHSLVTILLVTVILWGALRCAWLVKLIALSN